MHLYRVDYEKIQHLASHERNVTKNHYLTICLDAMHRWASLCLLEKVAAGTSLFTDLFLWQRIGGFGPNWCQAQVAGRQQVPVPPDMRDQVMPGIRPLLASLRVSHPDHPMLLTLEALDWLVDVWCQDMPLKLVCYGKTWAHLFPREVAAATRHPRWLEFANQVLASDSASKAAAAANRDWKGNPVQVDACLLAVWDSDLSKRGYA